MDLFSEAHSIKKSGEGDNVPVLRKFVLPSNWILMYRDEVRKLCEEANEGISRYFFLPLRSHISVDLANDIERSINMRILLCPKEGRLACDDLEVEVRDIRVSAVPHQTEDLPLEYRVA